MRFFLNLLLFSRTTKTPVVQYLQFSSFPISIPYTLVYSTAQKKTKKNSITVAEMMEVENTTVIGINAVENITVTEVIEVENITATEIIEAENITITETVAVKISLQGISGRGRDRRSPPALPPKSSEEAATTVATTPRPQRTA